MKNLSMSCMLLDWAGLFELLVCFISPVHMIGVSVQRPHFNRADGNFVVPKNVGSS